MEEEQKIEDNRLATFRRVCSDIGEERSYLSKAKILQTFFKKGADKQGFKGDALLWIQLLIPGASQRVYNLQNKQMVKLFARLFAADPQEMHLDLEQEGDVSETLRKFFEASKKLKPQAESTLYLQEVEKFLKQLEQKTKEDEQADLLRQMCRVSTAEDLKMMIRLIKQDLRINAGARHILDGLGPFAYPAYQSSRDLEAVVRQFGPKKEKNTSEPEPAKAPKKGKGGQVQVMTPISPMLANACKSVEEAFKKSPAGLFSEVKYDGERVQIHKRANQFKFFSRNLKPVMDHKVKRFKEFIPKAFPGGGDMILDSEIILVDTVSGELLPFGTLGAHKKKEFAKAEVCLFVFDCILYNGEDTTSMTFRQRRKILEDNIKPIKSYVQLSESHFLKTKNELSLMTAKVLKANLEGVVLKSPAGTYQPGKRGWLKVKKDYLFGGKMADTADLVVLGGWFGSGKKGGILSIFLMGTYDKRDKLWKTVTKVHSGLDDATMDEMHAKLMEQMERGDPNKVPNWLLCKKSLVPDYIAKKPEKMPVWEITGAEFTKSEAHTASGISIRFPRITKLRDDKSAEEVNDLEYLEQMFEASKKDVNVDLLMANCKDEEVDEDAVDVDSKLSLNTSGASESSIKQETEAAKSPAKRKSKTPTKDADAPSPKSEKKSPKDSPKSEKKSSLESEKESPSDSAKSEEKSMSDSPIKASPGEEKKSSSDSPKSEEESPPEREGKSPSETTLSATPSSAKKAKKESPQSRKKNTPRSGKKSEDEKVLKRNLSADTEDEEDKKKKSKKPKIDKENSAKPGPKQLKLDFSAHKIKRANSNEADLFKDIVAFFSPDILDEKCVRDFEAGGGTVTKDTKAATMVFYKTAKVGVDLANCRDNYTPTCRHLSVQWLQDSVSGKKFLPFPIYAVVLKQ